MINDFSCDSDSDSDSDNDDKYFERRSSTASYIHNRQNGLPYSLPSKTMEFYTRGMFIYWYMFFLIILKDI